MSDGVLDEAYDRLHHTGPEWGDALTNHGPMAAEVLARRGRADQVTGWVDAYLPRLDELPTPTGTITDDNWRDALGQNRQAADWIAYLTRDVTERPWRDVLTTWWPRLLPGIVAGATHGVIRVGHAVRAITAGDTSPAARTELAHGLAFWAARTVEIPGATPPAGTLDAAAALAAVPRIPRQSGLVADRFGQLDGTAGWRESLAALRTPADPDDARDRLTDLVTAGTLRYRTHGHASPVLLVHVATAPNAVLHTLPVLPRELWAPSLAAVWSAVAAITAAYDPGAPAPDEVLPSAPDDADPVEAVLDRAVAHRDEHVIKFADTATEVFQRTGEPGALAAAVRVTQLIGRPG